MNPAYFLLQTGLLSASGSAFRDSKTETGRAIPELFGRVTELFCRSSGCFYAQDAVKADKNTTALQNLGQGEWIDETHSTPRFPGRVDRPACVAPGGRYEHDPPPSPLPHSRPGIDWRATAHFTPAAQSPLRFDDFQPRTRASRQPHCAPASLATSDSPATPLLTLT